MKQSESLSVSTIVFLVFLVLKLCHIIDWSWWLVTVPLWLPLAVQGAFLITLGIFGVLAYVVGILTGGTK